MLEKIPNQMNVFFPIAENKKMYQRGRSAMLALEDVELALFDGHTPHISDWVDELEVGIRRFSPAPPFAFILSTIRSHLTDEAAKWWDDQKILPNDFETVRNMLIARFTVGHDYVRTSMTHLMSKEKIGSVMAVLKRVDSVQSITSTMHRDYPIIMKALSLMDCPVVVKRLTSLSLENGHYSWRAFHEEVRKHYALELAHQAQLCQPFISHAGKLRFGDTAEYHYRSDRLSCNAMYCVICWSTQHRSEDCAMLKDILALRLF